MKKLLIIVSFGVLVSCDPYSEAYLCNESKVGLEITIKIDQEFIEENWQGDQKVRFLKEFGKRDQLIELSTDTVAMQAVYKLESGKCSLFYAGISSSPRFIFNYLKIISKDKTLVYDTREEIEKAFLSSDDGKYRLVVKE